MSENSVSESIAAETWREAFCEHLMKGGFDEADARAIAYNPAQTRTALDRLQAQAEGKADPVVSRPPVLEPKAEASSDQPVKTKLTLDKKPLKIFVADILDAAPKDDLASMEHPLFALRAGDKRVRTYERGETRVTVKPGTDGCATIHDKDVWIYCISQLVEAMNRGRDNIDRTIRFTAYDFLVTTDRDTSGRAYQRLGDALARLSGTRIETNVATNGRRERAGFGLIDSWRIIERGSDDRMVAVEVVLPDWLWRSVEAKQVLTLSREYFKLRKPLDRRLYELARKHCGSQSDWSASTKALYEKSGSADALRNFRAALRELAVSNRLPDYYLVFDEDADLACFCRRS